jgi:hypothetical protein
VGIRDILVNPLGFGTAPLGNMFRDIPDDEAAATVDAAWTRPESQQQHSQLDGPFCEHGAHPHDCPGQPDSSPPPPKARGTTGRIRPDGIWRVTGTLHDIRYHVGRQRMSGLDCLPITDAIGTAHSRNHFRVVPAGI